MRSITHMHITIGSVVYHIHSETDLRAKLPWLAGILLWQQFVRAA